MAESRRKGPPAGATRTIRIDVQYDGTAYVGWQRQPKGVSIQGVLEAALSKVADERVTLFGSSRTDAGVHALHQVASFSLKKSRTPARAFFHGTNSILPPDIRVIRAEEADLGFLASRDTREKTYRYFLRVGKEPEVFLRNYAWHVPGPLNVDAMEQACRYLIGKHDFLSFRASRSFTKTSTRTVRSAAWRKGPAGLIYFEVTANGFLKHMVRSLVGTLVETGLGKRKPGEMREILKSRDRTKAGMSAPPHGLFLWRVVI